MLLNISLMQRHFMELQYRVHLLDQESLLCCNLVGNLAGDQISGGGVWVLPKKTHKNDYKNDSLKCYCSQLEF